MFAKLMESIDDDYLRYVFHVQVLSEEAAEPDLAQASYVAAEDPVMGDAAITAAFAAATPEEIEAAAAVAGGSPFDETSMFDSEATQAPIVKSDREKIGRNDPCWCGSGKKFKLCHGAA